MKNCAYCGRKKDEKDLIKRGKAKICWLCDENQNREHGAKTVKSSGNIMENSDKFYR